MAVLSGFFGWLYRSGSDRGEPDGADRSAEALSLLTTSALPPSPPAMFGACSIRVRPGRNFCVWRRWRYLGPRRNAASSVRRRDVDIDAGTIRFREKGGKVIEKPLPDEFVLPSP